MSNIMQWMNSRKLKINPEKTEIGLFHPKFLEDDVIINGTHIGEQCIRFSDVIKNVGVLLDNQLLMRNQVNKVVSYSYKLLNDIRKIRPILSMKHTEMLVHSVVTSRLDYCNSLYINLDANNTFKLQKVQNYAARVVVRQRKRQSARPILHTLHWLNIKLRVIFKILLLTYKSIVGQCSSNLSFQYKSYNCRPDDFLKLELTFAKTNYGKRTFCYTAPRLWNSLPIAIRSSTSVESFKCSLKTFLFEHNTYSETVLNW